MVESIRAQTPTGVWESRRLPGSGAGPSPDRLLLGSEGTLGVISEAWLRVVPRPTHRASGVARFSTFAAGSACARALAQSGLWPSNCRLIDATEALITGAGDGTAHLLLVGFESADHPVDAPMARAVELVGDHGSELVVRARSAPTDTAPVDAADSWRSTFLRAPYIRDALVRLGLVNETFETAITWDKVDEFVPTVIAAVHSASAEVGSSPAVVTCRYTHVYPDGAAPYFTVIAPGRPGLERLAQWAEVKTAVMELLDTAGATVTHHHAVGRDHRPGYDRQRPDPFARALVAAKAELDPHGILNPGVLVDPRR
jgi:alkyldihydroxyacetonephosphate synthase